LELFPHEIRGAMFMITKLLNMFGRRQAIEAFTKILSHYYLGTTVPEQYPRINETMYKILLEMDKYDSKHQSPLWYFKRNVLRKRVPMRDFKKSVFVGLLMLEGFTVKFFNDNEEVYKVSKNVNERIDIVNKDNWIYLHTAIHEGKRDVLGTVQEERQFITNTKFIDVVYIRDDDFVDYEDLLNFVKQVETYRWRIFK
jgi:hypothetical protein